MTNEMKAALETVKFFVIVVLGVGVLMGLTYMFGTQAVYMILMVSLFITFCWLIYNYHLTNIKFKDKKGEYRNDL
jgi:putative flippase GtrA